MAINSRLRGMRDPCASAMEMYSQVASSATKAVATITSKKDPLSSSSRTRGTRTAAVMTRFILKKHTRLRSPGLSLLGGGKRMITVGVSEARNQWSALLDRVERGEAV